MIFTNFGVGSAIVLGYVNKSATSLALATGLTDIVIGALLLV